MDLLNTGKGFVKKVTKWNTLDMIKLNFLVEYLLYQVQILTQHWIYPSKHILTSYNIPSKTIDKYVMIEILQGAVFITWLSWNRKWEFRIHDNKVLYSFQQALAVMKFLCDYPHWQPKKW